MKHKLATLLLCVLLSGSTVLCAAGCEAQQSGAASIPAGDRAGGAAGIPAGSAASGTQTGVLAATAPVLSYRDIPGITDAEIAAIETLASSGESLTIGALPSLDIFIDSDGNYSGFVPLLCELFTDLFGIAFVPEIYDWEDLIEGIDSRELDFTTSVNMPADMECHYFHTSPVAGNKLSVFTLNGGPDIASEYDLRGLKVGFYKNSYTEKIVRGAFPRVDFESVEVSPAPGFHQINAAYEILLMLEAGEIDAFITDTADVFSYSYENVTRVKNFPDVYIPVTISTANPAYGPLISVITRYLMLGGGHSEIDRLYGIGEHNYASHVIWQALNQEEKAYIDNLAASGTKVPVGATAARYPVAFYSREAGEYQGIAIDVLNEISALTGIEFYFNCDETTTWGELEGMLRDGEIALLSQLIPNEPRSEYAIWPDAPYFTARYALLSNIEYPFLRINQVPYASVGLVGGTAEEAIYNLWFPEDTMYKTYVTTDDGLAALETWEIDLFFTLDYTMLYESNYRENPDQKINIIFDEPVEPVPFGLNKDEQILCSIISKAQDIINTDRIARAWTSRLHDQSAQIAEERMQLFAVFSACLLVLLIALSVLLISSQRLKRKVEIHARETLEANRNLQVLLDMAPTAIIISRRGDGIMLYSNKAGLDLFNCESFNDVRGHKSFDYMPQLQPDGRESVEIVKEFWNRDKGTAEFWFLKKTGELFPARLAYCEINYYGERASLNVVEDMTVEREYQQMLRNAAQKELEANQLKSRFLATMSHEIRTPMNAIIGMTDLALRESYTGTKNEHILTIKQAGANLLSLINDILDFSKIEAGKMEIVMADYSIATLLNDIVSTVRMRVVDSPVNFTTKIDSKIPRMLYGDETRIRQAVLNILNNAVKYTEKGFVSLSVYMRERAGGAGDAAGDAVVDAADCGAGDAAGDALSAAVHHRGEIPSGMGEFNLIFEVNDSGIGIRAEDIDKLFEDFTQLDIEKNRFIEGVGLGLAITYNIIEAMGGTINVESEYGKGSTFTITIPQRFSSSEPLAAVDDPGAKKVLIYTHNDNYMSSVAYTLTNLGVGYTAVTYVAELFEMLESGQYDFLFISYSLYNEYELTIWKFVSKIKIAVLAEFGETVRDMDIAVLTMPVYCTVISDVLRGVYENASRSASGEASVMFTAPDARVLIVDDIYTNLKVAEGLLSPCEMRVDLVNNGAAAIDAITKAAHSGEPYDLVFMDHKMPVMDGVEATKRIREAGMTDIPIVALTANAVAGVMEMLMENGFNDYLSKPIDTVKLAAVLERWIPDKKKIR